MTKKKEIKEAEKKKPEEHKTTSSSDKETAKPSTKYHYSVKLTPSQTEKVEDVVKEAETPIKPFKESKEEEEETKKEEIKGHKKEDAPKHFTKETKAVTEAETETLSKEDVQHIKHSDKDTPPTKETSGGSCGSCTAQMCPKKAQLALLKQSIEQLDPEEHEEIKNMLIKKEDTKSKLPVLRKVANALTVKTAQTVAGGALKAIDGFITFVTSKGHERADPVGRARSPILFGMWVCILIFLVGGIWSSTAPLDTASHATGFIVPMSKKQIIQHREGGILEAMYVKEGDSVKTAQPLAKLNDKTIKSALNSAHAQKEATEIQLKIYQEQLKTRKELAEQDIISKTEVAQAELRVAEAKRSLSHIVGQLNEYEERLERLLLKSPVNGTVTQIDVHTIGGTVGQGAPIMTITPSEDDLILEAYVNPTDIESIHIGLKAKITISAFRARSTAYLEGVVTYKSTDTVEPTYLAGGRPSTQESMIFQRGSMYKVRIAIDKSQLKKISKEKDYELVPGMMADITIVTGERTLLLYLLEPILFAARRALIEK